ncbi:MAG: class I SAM-dependent methyltransferase [Deltaproteobacteria bacterium]|nr:class I SAM-dependent methyltransferase [Deltaproteobacteria bacterium]
MKADLNKTILNEIIQGFAINHINTSESTIKKLEILYILNQKWRKVFNITNNYSKRDFLCENILDPALSFFAFNKEGGRGVINVIIDVGCGNGCVGFIWKILLNNQVKLVLVDSNRKKINFCKQVARELKLGNVVFENGRVEAVSRNDGDIILTRATWGLNEFVKKCTKLRSKNGALVAFCSTVKDEDNVLEGEAVKDLVYMIMPWGIERRLRVVF